MSENLILYSADWCPDCRQLRQFLDKHKIKYENRDIQANRNFRKDLMENVGEIAVPFLIVHGQWVRGYPNGQGYSETYAKKLLKIK